MDVPNPVQPGKVDFAQSSSKVNLLPLQPTSFIGREQELAYATHLLSSPQVRLLTLTGPGGVGKTRLALKVAESLLSSFYRINFVKLAQVRDWQQVLPALARSLELPDITSVTILSQLIEFLRPEQRLLVLDNFEQVAEAAPNIAELQAACPFLKVLVTSRVPLHIGGEQEFPVAPLELPDLKKRPGLDQLGRIPSIDLFVQRTRSVNPYFTLNENTASPIAEICVCLDGLPLAIELAAARCKFLPPQTLLERLMGSEGMRLKLLIGGAKDAQARQQTLRNTLDWSYDLLEAKEKWLFRHLAVFYGGFMLEAVETIMAGEEKAESSLQILSSLVDKNLVRQEEVKVFGQVTARFRMLEIIREYAFEKLVDNDELEEAQHWQAEYLLNLAEKAAPELKKKDQLAWVDRLELDYANFRVVLKWAYDETVNVVGMHSTNGPSTYEWGLRMVQALWWFWMIRGLTRESFEIQQQWLGIDQAALKPSQINTRATLERAKIFYEAGLFAIHMNKHDRAAELCDEALKLNRQIGNLHGVALALNFKAAALQIRGDYQQAWTLSEESLDLMRQVGDLYQGAEALFTLGLLSQLQGNNDVAQTRFEESLAGFQAAGDYMTSALPLYGLGLLAQIQGDYETAIKYFEETLALWRSARSQLEIPYALLNLGSALLAQGNLEQAQRLYQESLDLFRETGIKKGLASALLGLGEVAFSQADYSRARVFLTESITLYREVADPRGLASALNHLSLTVLRLGKLDQANAFAGESMALYREVGNQADLACSLETRGELETARGNWPQAVLLYAEANKLRLLNAIIITPTYRHQVEARFEQARAALGLEGFEKVWAVGTNMTTSDEKAPTAPAMTTPEIVTAKTLPAVLPRTKSQVELTSRELEVLRLLAKGLTNNQIAEKLYVSPATINVHLTSVYSKLGVTSRSAATRYALDNNLV